MLCSLPGRVRVIVKRIHIIKSFFLGGGGVDRSEGRNRTNYPDEEIITLMSRKSITWDFFHWSLAGNLFDC